MEGKKKTMKVEQEELEKEVDKEKKARQVEVKRTYKNDTLERKAM